MLKFISSREGKIFTFGTLLLLIYLGCIMIVYMFSVDDANNLSVMTVTNLLFGRAVGISYGYSVHFSDFVIILVNIVIEFITVLIVYPLFVLSWNKSLDIKRLKKFFLNVKKQQLKYKSFFDKYGRYGLFIFVWFPFWMTGPVVGSMIGYLIGIRHYWTMLIVLAGTSLAIVVWTYFLKELIFLLNEVSVYASYIILGLFVVVAIIFKFINRK